MKCITCLFITAILVITALTVGAAGFSDIKKSDYYAEAANALVELDILSGYPDGTFGASKSITRAEMAAVICRTLKMEEDAEDAKGKTDFDDVDKNHWASGYINVAHHEGIINGYGAKVFAPDNSVKHEEALKMVVCALGYADDVEVDPDDWSAAYIDIADNHNITNKLRGSKGKKSTRGDVAVMIYNSLLDTLEAPTASLRSGSYKGDQTVTLKTETDDAEIYYTLDGSDPTANSNKYKNAITISDTSVFKAVTIKDGVLISNITVKEYDISHESNIATIRQKSSNYSVTFNLNYSGSKNNPPKQTIKKGECAEEPEEPIRSGYTFTGWATDKKGEEFFDFDTEIKKSVKLYAIWEKDEEPEEVNNDIDGDGLTNDDETNKYNTDPEKYDTDGDGASDGTEIRLGTNPLEAQASFEMNITAESGDDPVKASVEVNLPGEKANSLKVTKVDNDLLFPKEMPGYMGSAYNFEVDGNLPEGTKATLSFEFDESLVDENSEPCVYYYNEDKGVLEELETTVNGNVASTVVEHFSTYILLRREIFYKTFSWEDDWSDEDVKEGVEIVLVVDDSGSMGWNDTYNKRLDVAKDLVNNLPSNSKIGLIKFASSTSPLSNLTDKRSDINNYLNNSFYSSGGTRMYSAINSSFDMLKNSNDNIQKVIVVLSDGETEDTNLHNDIWKYAKNNNIIIHTVGLGTSTNYFINYLKPLAERTEGKFYTTATADGLKEIYEDIGKKIDITTDTDKDGIPDYYEDNMVAFNGIKYKLDKNNPDTDGDGILDGKEIILTITPNEDGSKVNVTGKIISDPCKPNKKH